MKQVVFVRFRDRASADSALAEMRRGLPQVPSRLYCHEHAAGPALAEQVQHSPGFIETDSRHGFFVGSFAGATVGALVGMGLFSWLFEPTIGPVVLGGALGIVMGGWAGVVMGGIGGMGLTDTRLRDLTQGLVDGEVVVTIEVPRGEVDDVMRVVTAHGGRAVRKRAV